MPLDLQEPDRAVMAHLGRMDLRLWQWGDPSAPAVVMAHGFFDHGRMFDQLAPRVAALGFHAVAVDMRGHGDSGRVSSSNWEAFTLDLGLLARRLGPPVIAIGHSFGGSQVMTAAAIFPELFSRVVNLDGMGPPPEYLRDDPGTLPVWLATFDDIHRRPQREYASIQELAERRRELNPRMPWDWLVHLAVHGSRPGPGGGLVWKSDPMLRVRSPSAGGEVAMLAQYGAVEAPVLVLTGGEADVFSDLAPEVLARRVSAIGDARHHPVPGGGHFFHLEEPDETFAQIEEFLCA